MKTTKFLWMFLFLFCISSDALSFNLKDPLPSWNAGSIKTSIIEFVKTVTDETSPYYVTPENRIATIDNDGTLWVEQPLYTQVIFMLSRYKSLSETHPRLQQKSFYSSILKNDFKNITSKDLQMVFAATSSNL